MYFGCIIRGIPPNFRTIVVTLEMVIVMDFAAVWGIFSICYLGSRSEFLGPKLNPSFRGGHFPDMPWLWWWPFLTCIFGVRHVATQRLVRALSYRLQIFTQQLLLYERQTVGSPLSNNAPRFFGEPLNISPKSLKIDFQRMRTGLSQPFMRRALGCGYDGSLCVETKKI